MRQSAQRRQIKPLLLPHRSRRSSSLAVPDSLCHGSLLPWPRRTAIPTTVSAARPAAAAASLHRVAGGPMLGCSATPRGYLAALCSVIPSSTQAQGVVLVLWRCNQPPERHHTDGAKPLDIHRPTAAARALRMWAAPCGMILEHQLSTIQRPGTPKCARRGSVHGRRVTTAQVRVSSSRTWRGVDG
jgi:hypothetical protein